MEKHLRRPAEAAGLLRKFRDRLAAAPAFDVRSLEVLMNEFLQAEGIHLRFQIQQGACASPSPARASASVWAETLAILRQASIAWPASIGHSMVCVRKCGLAERSGAACGRRLIRMSDYVSQPIKAPWTQEQVDSLNEHQHAYVMHPFTCGNCRARCLLPPRSVGCVTNALGTAASTGRTGVGTGWRTAHGGRRGGNKSCPELVSAGDYHAGYRSQGALS